MTNLMESCKMSLEEIADMIIESFSFSKRDPTSDCYHLAEELTNWERYYRKEGKPPPAHDWNKLVNVEIPIIIKNLYNNTQKIDNVENFYNLFHQKYRDFYIKKYPEDLKTINNPNLIKEKGDKVMIALLAHGEFLKICEKEEARYLIKNFGDFVDSKKIWESVRYIVDFARGDE